MDEIALVFAMSVAALSAVQPNWEEHENLANTQVIATAVGLIALSGYMIIRQVQL